MRALSSIVLVLVLVLAACGGSDIKYVYGEIAADPPSVDFGTVAPTVTAQREVTLRNDGRTELTVSAVSIVGDDAAAFEAGGPSTFTLAPGASAKVPVAFTGQAPGSASTGFLSIESNAANTATLRVGLVGKTEGGDAPDAGEPEPDAGTPSGPHDLVIFGGTSYISSEGALSTADVTRFDVETHTFTNVATAGTAPRPRYAHAAAWDAATQRMLVFGGITQEAGWDGATWALDFKTAPPTWSTVATTGPAARSVAFSAFDATHRRLYLYGGLEEGQTQPNDLWSFDAATNAWTRVLAAGEGTPPTARSGMTAAIDPVSGKLVISGGFDTVGQKMPGDTWAIDPLAATPAWSKLTTAAAPAARTGASLVAVGAQLFLFGGVGEKFQVFYDDLWKVSVVGSTWQQLPRGTPNPEPRWYASAASLGGHVYVYGGVAGGVDPSIGRPELVGYDPIAKTWTTLAQDNAPHAHPGTIAATMIGRE